MLEFLGLLVAVLGMGFLIVMLLAANMSMKRTHNIESQLALVLDKPGYVSYNEQIPIVGKHKDHPIIIQYVLHQDFKLDGSPSAIDIILKISPLKFPGSSNITRTDSYSEQALDLSKIEAEFSDLNYIKEIKFEAQNLQIQMHWTINPSIQKADVFGDKKPNNETDKLDISPITQDLSFVLNKAIDSLEMLITNSATANSNQN